MKQVQVSCHGYITAHHKLASDRKNVSFLDCTLQILIFPYCYHGNEQRVKAVGNRKPLLHNEVWSFLQRDKQALTTELCCSTAVSPSEIKMTSTKSKEKLQWDQDLYKTLALIPQDLIVPAQLYTKIAVSDASGQPHHVSIITLVDSNVQICPVKTRSSRMLVKIRFYYNWGASFGVGWLFFFSFPNPSGRKIHNQGFLECSFQPR